MATSKVPQELDEQGVFTLLKDEVSTLLTSKVDQEVDFEKTWQYLRIRKADLYYRGLQFIAPTLQSGFADYSPVGTPLSPTTEQLESQGLFDYNLDIVRSYGRKYFGTLGPRPFYNLKWLPDDPQSEQDKAAARQAELADAWLNQRWEIRLKNIEIFYWQWKAGIVYVYTPFTTDKHMFGMVEEPQYEQHSVVLEPAGYRCPNCGAKSAQPTPEGGCPSCGAPLSPGNFEEEQSVDVPELTGTKKYPGSGPACYLCTGYTVTVPFYTSTGSGFKQAPYLLYEYELNQGILLQMFPSLREKWNGDSFTGGVSGTSSQQGVISRAQAQSLTAMPRQGSQNTSTYSRYWLATSMYEFVKDDDLRDTLYKYFPNGLKVHRVDGIPVKFEDEDLAEVWSTVQMEPSDYVYQDPACWGILGQQDMKNDLANIGISLLERGGPTAFVDPDIINVDAMNQKPYTPWEVYETKPGAGSRIQDAMAILPSANFPKDLPGFDQMLDQNVQQYTGLLPPVWGGGERQPTAEGQRTVLNQALMQLSVPGEYCQAAWIQTKTNAIKQIAKHAPKNFMVSIPGRMGMLSSMLDLEVLRNGKFHAEAEPGIPMSFAEKRDQLSGIIRENPQVATALGLDKPINIGVIRDYLLTNTPELITPGQDVRDKVIERIFELLKGQPIPQPDGPPLPSVVPEDFVDDPGEHAELVREWLNDVAGRKAKADPSLQQGYANVVAYGLLCANKAGSPPPPPMKASLSLSGNLAQMPPQVAAQILSQETGVQVSPDQMMPPPPPMGAGGPQPGGPGPGQPPGPEQAPPPDVAPGMNPTGPVPVGPVNINPQTIRPQ